MGRAITKELLEELFPAEPLPDFRSATEIRSLAAKTLLPPKRISISEAARKYRFVNNPGGYVGPWNNDTAPYMVEPMDCMNSRDYQGLVFVGAAQSLKTDSLILNALTHKVVCEPLDTLIVQTTQMEARKFSRGRITKLIDDCPEVRSRLSPNKDDNNVHDKRFVGMDLTIGWPTINWLSGTPIPWVLFTDYDRMDADIGGEGEPFDLGRGRNRSFGSLGLTAAESSPGSPILKAGWKPSKEAPHEAPPAHGILSLYNRGDRRRRYWQCPGCDEFFEPRFNLLKYPEGVPIATAAAEVVMQCPNNGCIINQEQRNAIDKAGVWLKEGQAIDATRVITGAGRQSLIASFWAFGVVAALSSWSELVRNYLTALEVFELTGSEDALKTTVNIDQAEAYLPKALEGVQSLNADVLADRAKGETYKLRTVPEGVRFLTAAVDTQQTRFEVKVEGWGIAGENWTVDYFQIFKSADGERMLDPAMYAEDWDLLIRQVVLKAYPLADGSGRSMPIMITGVDMHGPAGVSKQAYDFWRRAKIKGLGRKVRLLRGDPTLKHSRFVETYPDSQRKDRNAGARGEVPVIGLGSNLIKDEVLIALKRSMPGRGYMHHSAELVPSESEKDNPTTFFKQLTAEELKDEKWQKVRARNEVFDLTYMNRGLWLYLKADRINWEGAVPRYALPWSENPTLISATLSEDGTAVVPQEPSKKELASRLA